MTSAQTPTKISILVLPAFNVMTTMALIDPFRAANYLAGQPIFSWRFVSAEPGFVTASNGVTLADVTPLTDIMDEDADDLVIVSSSWTPEEYSNSTVLGWLRRRARLGATIGGLDTGAFVLAYAGLLGGHRATVHYEHMAAFRELFPGIEVVEDLYTLDDSIVTCCGGIASSDLALTLIRDRHGLALANATARYIFHDRLRTTGEGQAPAHFEPVGYAVPDTLRRAIVTMEEALETPMRIGDIAQAVGLSQRQLERLFHEHTGVSPIQYYLEMRLDRARGMVTQTDMPFMAIAVACGFSSQEHFSRAYKKRFSAPPSVDRSQGRIPFQFRSFPNYRRVPGERE